MHTVLTEAGATQLTDVSVDGDALWLSADQVTAATGWVLKPEGLCRDDICVPVPPQRAQEFVRDGNVNIAAFWQLMDRPVLHDHAATTWMLGAGSQDRARALQTLNAPDFELPDIDGQLHKLSDFRGKRVFLTTWSSW